MHIHGGHIVLVGIEIDNCPVMSTCGQQLKASGMGHGKLICHIGHGKTGSSYIQSVLAINATLLESAGIHYPEAADHHKALKGLISSGNYQFLESDRVFSGPTTLISGERLFNALPKGDKLETLVLSKSNDVTVVLYVRDIIDFLVSAWLQSVKKADCTVDLDDFLPRKAEVHCARLLWWAKASQRQGFRLIIRNYSRHRTNLLRTFFSDLFEGSPSSELIDRLTLPPTPSVNRSLSTVECKIQMEFNKRLAGTGRFLGTAFVNSLPNIKAQKPRIDPVSYRTVRALISPTVEEFNSFLDPAERLLIEPIEGWNDSSAADVPGRYHISEEQICILVEAISTELLRLQKRGS